MRLESGSHLGPYEITGFIGAGGMGEVYRARDTRLRREVAIKVLPRAMFGDSERLARFKREAISASALNHRNIVTVHDFTSSETEAWLVMELVKGESLAHMIQGRAIPFKRVLELGTGIADGLAAAHAAGIVHRDLKPDNVMVGADGTPKILDFGLVKHATVTDPNSATELRDTRDGVVMGTVAYMSPEQARGEVVDFRSDQFSLGMILYEMATGKHPFERSSGMGTVAAILNEEAPALDPEFSPFFAEIVSRCLAKNKEERYGSTADLAHDLRLVGHRTSSGMHLATGAKGNRRWLPVAIAALLLVSLGAAWMTFRSRDTEEFGGDAYYVSVATPEFAQVFRNETALPVALSPDGRYLVAYGMDTNTVTGLSLHDLRTGTSRMIAQNAFSMGWSPDSKSVAFFSEGKLKTVSVDGGPPRVVCDARPESTISWKGDDILFAQYSLPKPGVYRVNANGGTPAFVESGGSEGISFWPEFLPDGKHFLYLKLLPRSGASGGIEHELLVGSLDGGQPRLVAAGLDSRAVYSNDHLLYVRDGTLLAQPFDPETAELSGEARPLVHGLHYFRSTGLAAFSVSDNGLIAWRAPVNPSRLVIFDRAGTELKELGVRAFEPGGRLSADGARYAVGVIDPQQGIGDVWIYDLGRESSERVTFRQLDEKSPVWAADGISLLYRGDGNGPPDVFRWTPGAEGNEVVYAAPGVQEPHDVSPDGKTLLVVNRSQTEDIVAFPLTTKGPARSVVVTPFNEESPRFSGDGRWIAYQSDVSGRPEVYVRPHEGVAAATRISKDGGTLPRWKRDGTELYFLAPGGKIMSAAMHEGTSTATPRVLFQAPEAVDLEPDATGTHFLVQLEQRTSEPPIRILINWPARLRQTAP